MERTMYPESLLPKRSRDMSAALSRRAASDPLPPTRASQIASVMLLSPRYVAMDLRGFQAADYGQLCQHLGLSPSRPHANAAGKDTRKRRRRPRVTS